MNERLAHRTAPPSAPRSTSPRVPPPPDVPVSFWLRPLVLGAVVAGILLVALLLLFLRDGPSDTEITPEELAILMAEPPPPSDLPPLWSTPTRPSDLRLRTEPAGAAVQLNNEWIGTTPVELDGIQPGFYTLRIAKPDHVARDTAFYLASGASIDLTLRLRSTLPEPTLVEPIPDRSDAFASARPNRTVEDAPRSVQQRGRPAGGGGAPLGFDVASPEEVRQVTHTGSLSITSNPPGAIVLVDGVVMGRAPLSLNDLSPGSYVVTLTLPGIVPLSYQAEVMAQSVAVVKGDFSILVDN